VGGQRHATAALPLGKSPQYPLYRRLGWGGHRASLDKAVPLQAWTGPEGSRKLRFPDFVTTAQDGGRLSAPAAFTPQEIFLVLISVRG